MAFMPSSFTTDERGLVLTPEEAARQRALETAREQAARELVEAFFGLERRGRVR
jgi:hypothetical protein